MAVREHPFSFGERVIADGDAAIQMRVTAFTYRGPEYTQVECSYFENGDHKCVLIELWRLQAA